jgi:hypothetical protein
MIGRETCMLLRHYFARGFSKSALARQPASAAMRSTAGPVTRTLTRRSPVAALEMPGSPGALDAILRVSGGAPPNRAMPIFWTIVHRHARLSDPDEQQGTREVA